MQIIKTTSRNTVQKFYKQVVQDGYMIKHGKWYEATDKMYSIQSIDHVKAGYGDDDACIEYVTLDSIIPFDSRRYFAQGDSMINACIDDGDELIVINRQPKIKDIVIATIDGKTTVKSYYGDHLKAANPYFEDMYPEHQLEILGVVIKIIKNL